MKGRKASEVFVYEQIEYNFNYKDLTVSIDDDDIRGLAFWYYTGSEGTLKPVYIKNREDSWNSPKTFAAVIDLEKSSGLFPKKLTEKFGGVFKEGMDKGFTDGGKGQVILSEVFVKALGLEPEDVYGNTFSLKYLDSITNSILYGGPIFIDNDSDPSNNSYDDFVYDGDLNKNPGELSAFLCHEYEVVGIIKSEVTEFAQSALTMLSNNYSTHFASNLMFFTTQSLYTEDNTVIEPMITQFLPNDENFYDVYYLATYPMSPTEIEELNKEYIALGVNVFTTLKGTTYDRGSSENLYSKQRILFEADNYKQLDDQMKAISVTLAPYLVNASNFDLTLMVVSYIYRQLNMLYSAFTYVIMAFSILGGIIFFAAMVNLFNSIVHSVDLRRNYLGVMRAIGAKDSVIPRLYLAEAFTIFRRALIWVIIFSSALCYGLKMLIDSGFDYINRSGMLPIQLGINIIYIPMAIGIGVFLLMLLGILFSYGCSRKVSKKRISEVLGAS